jgi:hypothetical protein
LLGIRLRPFARKKVGRKMIQKVEMFTVVCERCGKQYSNDDLGYCAWVDGSSAREDAEECGWQSIEGKDYCPDCYEYDEETDDYKPKEKEKTK